MENKKSTDVYAGSGVEKAAKWFHIMAIISIVLSVIGVIAGVVLIFMAYEGESVGIKLFSAFLLCIPDFQEIIAGVLGLKVKEDPTKVMPPVILYIVSIVTLFILTITRMGRSMGLLGLLPPIVGIVTGLQINKWVKAGMPYNDQTKSFPS